MDVAWGANTGDEHPDEVQRIHAPKRRNLRATLHALDRPIESTMDAKLVDSAPSSTGDFQKGAPAMDDADENFHSHRLPRLAF